MQFRSPQASVEPSLRSGFYIEAFGLLNHVHTYEVKFVSLFGSKIITLNKQYIT